MILRDVVQVRSHIKDGWMQIFTTETMLWLGNGGLKQPHITHQRHLQSGSIVSRGFNLRGPERLSSLSESTERLLMGVRYLVRQRSYATLTVR